MTDRGDELELVHNQGCGLEPAPHDHIIRTRGARRILRSPAMAAAIVIGALEDAGSPVDVRLAGALRTRYGIPSEPAVPSPAGAAGSPRRGAHK